MSVYLDASALVKRYVEELDSDQVRRFLAENRRAATAVITRVEVVAAVTRALHMQRLKSEEGELVLRIFQDDWKDLIRIPLNCILIEEAAALAHKHVLRGYDAVHLASALFYQRQLGKSVVLATFDKELWQAANHSGLQPWPEHLNP